MIPAEITAISNPNERAFMAELYTIVYAQSKTLNYYLSTAGLSVQYHHVDTYRASPSNYTYTAKEFDELIALNIINGHPVQIPLKWSGSGPFGYTSQGHYMVIAGINYQGAAHAVTLTDPYGSTATHTIAVSEVQSLNQAHSGFLICVD